MDFELFMKSSVNESRKKFEDKDESLPALLDEESEDQEESQIEEFENNGNTDEPPKKEEVLLKGITGRLKEVREDKPSKDSTTNTKLQVSNHGEDEEDKSSKKRLLEDKKEEMKEEREYSKKQKVFLEASAAQKNPIEESDQDLLINGSEIASNPEKVAVQIRQYIKNILAEWTDQLNERQKHNEEQEKQKDSVHDLEQEQDLLLDTKRSLIPLLILLKNKNKQLIEKSTMFPALSTVIHYLQLKNFLKANEAYMSLSIGNVAWPIGVIGVGIHARSAQSKITGTANMANVMLDEVTRKWITSIKRLITFCEKNN